MFKHGIDMEYLLAYTMLQEPELLSVNERMERSRLEQFLIRRLEALEKHDGNSIRIECGEDIEFKPKAGGSREKSVDNQAVKSKNSQDALTNDRKIKSKPVKSQDKTMDNQIHDDNASKEDVSFNTPKVKDTSDNQKEEQQVEKKSDTKDENAKKLKRKLKKLRQKEKKRNEKLSATENNEDTIEDKGQTDSIKDSESVISHVDNQEKISEQEDLCSNDEASNVKEIDENEEFDFLNSAPAFVNLALKKVDKKPMNTKQDVANVRLASSENNNINIESNAICNNYTESYNDSDNESFTFVKGKRTRKISENRESPESIGAKAIKLIMKNKIQPAVKHLSDAIELNPHNVYHYVNRGFCYLRLKEYSLAKEDAQYVIVNCQDNKILLKAKYILSQALFGLKNYEGAEQHLQECLFLAPNSFHFQRELLRYRLVELTNLGFSEEDAVEAIKESSTVLDAICLLVEKQSGPTESHRNASDEEPFDENEVYLSDDSETDDSIAS